MIDMTIDKVKKIWRERFYSREIEVFRKATANEYGIRVVWRSKIKTPDGFSGWRKYSSREGGASFIMTFEQIRQFITDADSFVRKM